MKLPVCGFLALLIPGLALAMEPCLQRDSLPQPSGPIIEVASTSELNSAVANLSPGDTIRLQPGTYPLSSTLYLRKNNVTLFGAGEDCGDVVLSGNGMDNANHGNVVHGIWSDAQNLTIMNLTIRDIYEHGIVFNSGAQAPLISSVAIINTGTQFIKANPTGYSVGVDDGVVENSLFWYDNGPAKTDHGAGVGYFNGIDVHGGSNWRISNNRFENFHTPDSAVNLWNPAILMWNGASNTIAENNVFIDVDRAIAFGLVDRSEGFDHQGGIIRNNMIYNRPGLFSANRKYNSDAAILVWNSPNTAVAHNTILTSGNLNKSIEMRFNSSGTTVVNNLLDAPIGVRNGGTYNEAGNFDGADAAMFVDPQSGNLRLKEGAQEARDRVDYSSYAPEDIDGTSRSGNNNVDVGAHEFVGTAPPMPPSDVRAIESNG